jgi:hypothetical protein
VFVNVSAGNYTEPGPVFPANISTVLAVAGAQTNTPGQPTPWSLWYYGTDSHEPGKVIGTAHAGSAGVVAPARAIVSTMPSGFDYNDWPQYKCADVTGVDESGPGNNGYSSCTGTSMAAPFESALVGMLRSTNPRLTVATIKSVIASHGDHSGMLTSVYGSGITNALAAVNDVIGRTTNRLTPLFAFYSTGRLDYFYTTVPQMAAAAVSGTLRPSGTGTPATINYTTQGTTIAGYTAFPGVSAQPKAQVWVFTTPLNPKSATTPLVPLYRLSWKCGDPSSSPPAICSTNPQHVDVTYTADPAGIPYFQGVGYKLDGVEGYIYPLTTPQPVGTVRLMRKYNPTRDDNAIFPETLLSTMTAQGYTDNSGGDTLGYVYVNTGPVPTI